jgi:4-amino-4-deoxy-L-arabinose transferase-like glycosyltransferase
MEPSEKTETLIMLIVAFLLRLAWVLTVDNQLLGDAPWFDMTAKGLVTDHRYHYEGTSTAFFPVGYPAFLALVYWIAGPHQIAAKIANAVLSSIICLVAYLLAKQVFDKTTARITLAIMTLFPSQIFYTSLLTTEVLFTTFLLVSMYLFTTNKSEEVRGGSLFFGGVFLGLTCLVRSIPIFMPFVLLVYWKWIKMLPVRKIITAFMAVALGMASILLPWIIRNALVFNNFVLVSTNGGVNFWLGQVKGRFVEAPERFTANWLRRGSSPQEELAAEKLAYREAFDFLKAHPATPLLNFPKKLYKFWYADIDGLLHNSGLPRIFSPSEVLPIVDGLRIPYPRYIKISLFVISQGYYMLILFGFVTGIFVSIKYVKEPRIYFLLLFIAAWTLFHTLAFFPLGRYRFPIAPLIAVFAGYGFKLVFARLRKA